MAGMTDCDGQAKKAPWGKKSTKGKPMTKKSSGKPLFGKR